MAEKQQLTKAGKQNLENELYDLIHNVRDEVKKQLAEARAQGDLSENADYDAARDRQAQVEGRIKEIEEILANAVIINDSKSGNKIALGSTVTVRYIETGKEYTYKIVGTVESDPVKHMISNACPLGEALIGKSVGDIIDVKGNVVYKVEILNIQK